MAGTPAESPPDLRLRPITASASKRQALLLAISVLLSLLLVEAVAWAAGVRIYALNLLTYDSLLGWSYRPGKHGWFDSESWFRINSDGLRDRDHAAAKPPGTVRIALLGDSFTAGIGVAAEQTFGAVVGRKLSSCPALGGRAVETINFGVQGYGAAQELLTLRHRVWKYQPDLVLLAVYTGNDISDSSREICCGTENLRPYFIFADDGELKLDDSFNRSPLFPPNQLWAANVWRDIRSYSRLTYLLWNAAHALIARDFIREALNEEDRRRSGDPSVGNEIYLPTHSRRMEQAWLMWEATIRLIRDEVRAHRTGFWMTIVSNDIQVHPNSSVQRAFLQQLGTQAFDYPNRRIAAFAAREQIDLIDVTGSLANDAAERRLYLHGFREQHLGFGHWNAEGHHLGGEVMTAALCAGFVRDSGH